jgi:hypothetical protein
MAILVTRWILTVRIMRSWRADERPRHERILATNADITMQCAGGVRQRFFGDCGLRQASCTSTKMKHVGGDWGGRKGRLARMYGRWDTDRECPVGPIEINSSRAVAICTAAGTGLSETRSYMLMIPARVCPSYSPALPIERRGHYCCWRTIGQVLSSTILILFIRRRAICLHVNSGGLRWKS